MNLRVNGLCIVALGGLFAWGCRKDPNDLYKPQAQQPLPPAALTPGNESAILPLDPGNQWTYSATVVTMVDGREQPRQNFEVTWKIVSSKKGPNGTDAEVEISRNGALNGRQTWRVNSKGAYQLRDGLTPKTYDPPMPMILFPVKPNSTFLWEGSGPTPFGIATRHKSSSLVRGAQEVDTDMGRFSAFAVDSDTRVKMKPADGRSVSTVWFTPNIGIVRFRQEALAGGRGAVVVLKLKSKSLMRS